MTTTRSHGDRKTLADVTQWPHRNKQSPQSQSHRVTCRAEKIRVGDRQTSSSADNDERPEQIDDTC